MRRLLLALPLVIFASTLIVSPQLAHHLAAFRPLGPLDPKSVDEELPRDEREVPRFWDERNTVKVEVPRDMSLIDFLRLYEIDFQHVRRQIAEQMKRDSLGDGEMLRKGAKFRVDLTPPQADG